MKRNADLLLTAIAPVIWGSTYLVTTELLPQGYPLKVALLRALPAGLVLLLWVRQLPVGHWWIKSFVLGALNFSVFWWFLFIAIYRLPGGIAATVGAIQPLMVIFLAKMILGSDIRLTSVLAAIAGICGVALMILTPEAELDSIGVMAGLASAVSMAAGTVLTRHWKPPVSLLTFTAWQLTAGGLLLLPVALWFEPDLPGLSGRNLLGYAYLSLIGAALTYVLWFRGIDRFDPVKIAPLGFLSPMVAIVLGWWVLGQNLNLWQWLGVFIVFGSVWLNQRPVPDAASIKNRATLIQQH